MSHISTVQKQQTQERDVIGVGSKTFGGIIYTENDVVLGTAALELLLSESEPLGIKMG